MVTPQLLEYVQTQLKQGSGIDAIRQALLTSGWEPEDVDAVITQVNTPVSAVPVQPMQPGNKNSLNGPFPPELKHWNWGAFFLTFIWGLGNNVYLSLLMLVPGVNIIMWFVLGAKGNEWAWRHRRFQSVEEFKIVQKRWSRWGLVIFCVAVVMYAAGTAVILKALKNNNPAPTTSTTISSPSSSS